MQEGARRHAVSCTLFAHFTASKPLQGRAAAGSHTQGWGVAIDGTAAYLPPTAPVF